MLAESHQVILSVIKVGVIAKGKHTRLLKVACKMQRPEKPLWLFGPGLIRVSIEAMDEDETTSFISILGLGTVRDDFLY